MAICNDCVNFYICTNKHPMKNVCEAMSDIPELPKRLEPCTDEYLIDNFPCQVCKDQSFDKLLTDEAIELGLELVCSFCDGTGIDWNAAYHDQKIHMNIILSDNEQMQIAIKEIKDADKAILDKKNNRIISILKEKNEILNRMDMTDPDSDLLSIIHNCEITGKPVSIPFKDVKVIADINNYNSFYFQFDCIHECGHRHIVKISRDNS